MLRHRKLTAAALAALGLTGALAAGTAHARGDHDVQWSVTIGSHLPLPLPRVVLPAPVVVTPAPHGQRPVWQPYPHARTHPAPVPVPVRYREPTRWDHDGDGIPNHRDRVHNPAWDVDGDGIPNRHDRVYNPPRPRDRDGDGVPNRYDPYPNHPGHGGWRGGPGR